LDAHRFAESMRMLTEIGAEKETSTFQQASAWQKF
jgi:hypothetical protein